MGTFFAPAIGGSGVKVTAGAGYASVLIGAGNNAIRALNEGSGNVLAYFITYNSANGVPSIAVNAGTPLGSLTTKGNELIMRKPRDHDSVLYASSSATAVVLHFQPGEV